MPGKEVDRLHVIALSSDWFIALFASVVIGHGIIIGRGLFQINSVQLYFRLSFTVCYIFIPQKKVYTPEI